MKFCPDSRKFDSVEDMDESIIQTWNETVSPEDVVYILGDFAFYGVVKASQIASRLNGKKTLIAGNHDVKLVRDEGFRSHFVEVVDYKRVQHNGNAVIMMHYPIWSWDQIGRGSIHFHGHLHGNYSGLKGRAMDVGMDCNDCRPFDMDVLIEKMLAVPVSFDHHGREV